MDLSRGCILLARSIDKSDVFQNEKWLKVWIWCLIQANHKGKSVPVKTGKYETVVKLERGQFIFGRHKSAKKLNMKSSTVRNIMEKLEKLQNLDIHPDTHYSVVTIRDYDFYQNMENYKGQARGQAEDNQRTGRGQPKDTTKNDNNDNNDNNKTSKIFDDDSTEMKIAKYFFSVLQKSNPNQQEPNWQNWCKDIDLFLRKVKPEKTDIKKVIDWAHDPDNSTDKFSWIPNLRSPKKLREHFEKILLQIKTVNTKKPVDDGSLSAKQKMLQTQKELYE
jgi:hypothetical protein